MNIEKIMHYYCVFCVFLLLFLVFRLEQVLGFYIFIVAGLFTGLVAWRRKE